MQLLIEWGLDLARWLQLTYPQWEVFLRYLSLISRVEIYIILSLAIYWLLNKKQGTTLLYLIAVSLLSNLLFKHLFAQPRPYWFDPALQLGTEPSYGLPSGHVQAVSLSFFYLASQWRRDWLWGLAFGFVGLMMLGRLYLGVHFLQDVWLGAVLGIFIVVGEWVWRKYGKEWFRTRIFGYRLFVALLYPFLVWGLFALLILFKGAPTGVVWQTFVQSAEQQGWIGTLQATGLLIGLGTGFTLELARVGFQIEGTVWQKLLRCALGVAIAYLIGQLFQIVIDALTPPHLWWVSLPLHLLQTVFLGLWISFYAPWVFTKLHLAHCSEEPQHPFTVAGTSFKPPKQPKR